MKKLIVLALVLSMATIANAGLKIAVDGVVDAPDTSVNLRPSDTVMISIYSDGQSTGADTFILFIDGQNPLTLDIAHAFNVVNAGAVSYIGELGGMYDFQVTMDLATPAYPIPPLPTGFVVGNIVFHCEVGIPANDVTLTLLGADADPATVYDTQVIHQIPEPITMCLLGLGGLFLRRRSK